MSICSTKHEIKSEIFMKYCFVLLVLLLVACFAKGQTTIEVVPVDPNAKVETLDSFFIIYTTGDKFNVKFKKQNLSFSDSARLAAYVTKNLKKIDNKVAIQVSDKSNGVLYRIAVSIIRNNNIYSWRVFESGN
jgi:hypothetical protein